jgi:hypothetical protein
MRIGLSLALLGLSLVGCHDSLQEPSHSAEAAAPWRVIPLTGTANYPDRCAILVNQKTGDTWIYNSSDQWTPLKRN